MGTKNLNHLQYRQLQNHRWSHKMPLKCYRLYFHIEKDQFSNWFWGVAIWTYSGNLIRERHKINIWSLNQIIKFAEPSSSAAKPNHRLYQQHRDHRQFLALKLSRVRFDPLITVHQPLPWHQLYTSYRQFQHKTHQVTPR